MDEILHPGARLSQTATTRLAAAAEGVEQLRARARELPDKVNELLIRWDNFKQGRRLRPSQFLAAALLLGVTTTAFTLYTRGYAVSVDGQELGVVADIAQFETIQAQVEERVSDILGREYTMSGHVSYEGRIVEKKNLSSLAGFETFLFNQVGEVTRGYVLTLNDQILTVQPHSEELSALLDSLKAPYVNENTISAEFTSPVGLHYEYVGVDQMADNLEQVRSLLTSNTVEAITYTVQSGDTTSAIAQRHDMTLKDLLAMNPDVNADRLSIGQELTVRQNVPYLGVRTVDQVTYEETVPAPVEYVDDDSMYEGDTKTLDAGADGLNRVTARVTSLNGTEEARDIMDTQVLTAPLTKTVARGTKERPKTMAKGSFIWPVSGRITSRYGGRSLFGTYNFHGGLDIACAYGTAVKAADGGKVIFAGWQGSYGNLVIIDHENGKQTYYAHNSVLNVSVGQRVYQGQTIAKVGTTGNTSGPHCHFEVRINGQRTNPSNYLP